MITDTSVCRLFESFVNSEECKTITPLSLREVRLRALLIQKSVKLSCFESLSGAGLRALLIQKSVKHYN